jgi:hypothetical protein
MTDLTQNVKKAKFAAAALSGHGRRLCSFSGGLGTLVA